MAYNMLRGRVRWHLADPDTDPPAAMTLPQGPIWTLLGGSFFENDSVMLARSQTIEDEEALNELEPVGAWRNTDIKMLRGRLKDFTLESLRIAFNGNSITPVAATNAAVGYSEMSLDSDIVVAMYALICTVDASPYDSPRVRRPGFRTQIYFPTCAEKSDSFESPLGPKQTSMIPLEFQAYKSMNAGRHNLIRMTTAPITG